MKRISKALSLLLCVVMVISIGAISGQAVEISADSAVSTVENGPDPNGFFYVNGERQKAYKLLEYNGAWYFVAENHKYVKDVLRYLNASNLEGTIFTKPGYYYFDAQGRLFDRNGPDENDFFYVNNAKQKAYKLCEYNGDWYFVAEYNKICRGQRRYLNADAVSGTGFQAGYFDFDSDGKMTPRNGPNEDGFFYIDNVKQKAYKLCEYQGEYYFVSEYHKFAVNQTRYLSKDNLQGTGFSSGYYKFDELGRMELKNGPNWDGYFYNNNVKQKAYALKEFDGDYYFICENNKVCVNQTRNLSDSMVKGTPFPAGKYDFGDDGKLILKNGPQDDGYFYIDGIRQRAFRLIEYEGNYYYIATNHKYVRGRVAPISAQVVEGMTFSDGTPITEGYYNFDNDGKMIIDFVAIDGISNTRDIGGYENIAGQTIKKDMLLRGTELDGAVLEGNVITEKGKNKLLNTYGVKTEMDLRNRAVSLGDMLGAGVQHKYYNAPQYEGIFTEDGKAKMKAIFTDLSNPDNYPVYLHCSYGVDRTGTVCYILEAVLGLDETQLQAEYALSSWDYSYKQKYTDKIKTGLLDYSGSNIMQRAESYLLSCGVTQQQIDTLRQIFLY